MTMTIYSEQNLMEKIRAFGISKKSIETYISLVKLGQCGVMELSRHTNLGRNVLYKHLDELSKWNLISVSEKSHGKVYSAKQGAAFEALLASREAEISDMRSNIESITDGLLAMAGETRSASRIIHYEGRDGLEQVNWNMTKAQKEYRVYEQSHVDQYLHREFARKLRERYMQRNLISFDLTNQKEVKPYPDPQQFDYWIANAHYAYINPKHLAIGFEMYIYDDVLVLLDYSSDLPHCIEIHNQMLASMQKQIFDLAWNIAKILQFNKETNSKIIQKTA